MDTEGVVKLALSDGQKMAFYADFVGDFHSGEVVRSGVIYGDGDIHNPFLLDRNKIVVHADVSCGKYHIEPALKNLREFGSIAKSRGATVDIDSSGVTKVTVWSTDYFAKPSFFICPGVATGAPRLVLGADGNYSMVDSRGNTQKLNPTADTSVLDRLNEWLARPNFLSGGKATYGRLSDNRLRITVEGGLFGMSSPT